MITMLGKRLFFFRAIAFFAIIIVNNNVWSQGLSVGSCPTIDKRNNGNGQYSSSAGYFPNDPNSPKQDNPVAANIYGTTYRNVSFIPSAKTGFYNFYWTSAVTLTNFPVITRVWITADGSESPTLSSVAFGPPPPPVIVGQNYYINYSFYGQNIPPVGKITLEFTNPQTGLPAFNCTFDLKTNSTATTPTGFSCAPTISTQPSNQSLCGDATAATFTVSTVGAASWQWQVYDAGSNSWSNVSGADYSGATTATLIIANPTSYDGKQYRVIAAGTSAGCTTISSTATLVAKPTPTATFGSTNCTQDQQNVAITLTGTKPWSFTYNSGGGSTTISNITSSPYYLPMSGSSTYTITSLSDAYCTNSGTVATKSLPTKPTITLTSNSLNMCLGVGSISLSYTSTTNSPTQYSLSAGTRVMSGFSTLTNQTLTSSPVSISMPGSGVSAGTYDFNLTVTNSTTGCVSAIVPITVTARANPTLTATAGTGSVCKSTDFTLTAAPAGLSSYSWGINPATSGVGTGASVTTQITSTTTFKVLGTDSYGCTGTATVEVTAVSGPTLSITPSAPTICPGSAVALSVSGGNTYTWTANQSPAGLSATTGDAVVASPSSTTTYTVTSQNLSGCSSTGTVTVTVATVSIGATADATICSGGTKTLTGTGADGGSYYWYPTTGLYTDAGASTAYTGTSLATVYAKPSSTTTYYLRGVTSGNCEGTASSTVTISPAPVDAASSTANYYIFCVQNVSSINLAVKLNQAVTSATWAYSINGTSYTSFTTAQTNVGGTSIDLTPSSSGSSPNITYTCNVADYGNSGLTSTDPNYYRLVIVGSSCTYNYDIQIADTKGLATLAAPTASRTTICSGNSVVLSCGTIDANSTPIWQKSTTSSTSGFTDISGATSSTYTASPTTTTYYRVQFDNGNGNCGAYTSAITINVASALAANTVSTSTICTSGSGSNPLLDGSAITSGVYQWQTSSDNSSFSNILGATSEDYTVPTNILQSTTYYRRVASTADCSSTNSTSVALYPPISNNQITTGSATSYCGTASAITLSSAATLAGGNGTYAYKWQSSTSSSSSGFTDISPAATSSSYTTSSQSQTYWYKRIVTSNSGSCTDESSVIQVTVNPNPTVSVTANTSVCQGTDKTLTASGAQTYSWDANTTPTGLSSTTGASVIATPAGTRTYTVTGTNSYGCTNTASMTLTITSLPSAPTLTSSSTTICSNGSAVTLATYNPGSGTTEWYSVPSTSDATYKITTASTAGTYYAYVLSGGCYSSSYATFTLTVKDMTAPTVKATSALLCSGTFDLTTLEPVAASGTTLQWRTANSYGSGSAVSTPTAVSSGTYYLYATSSSPSCNSTASSGVTVTISSPPVASVSSSSASACSPSTINLTTYNNTSGTNTYSWYTSSSPSPASLVLIPTSVSSSGNYYLFATNTDGCQGTSATVAVTISSTPTSSVSASEDFCGTYSGSITATTDATDSPTYAWEYSTDNGVNWNSVPATSPYSNTTTSVLGISGLTVSSGGTYYRCSVTKSGCSATSSPAIVITQGLPTTTSCPSNTYMQQGTDKTFSTSYDGAADAIQWEYSTDNGVNWNSVPATSPYSGTTSSTLQITGAILSMNGYRYRATITNTCGTATCSAFVLSVGTALPVTWLSFSAQKKSGEVLLKWTTGSEQGSKDFEVQYSTNTTNWSPLGVVSAAGNSSTQRDYSFVHTRPLKNNNYNYYRILQRDLDGKFSYSKIVSILFNEPGPDVLVYPNPADEVLTIFIAEPQRVKLFNAAGHLVWESSLPAGTTRISANHFSSGVYILKTFKTNTRVVIR